MPDFSLFARQRATIAAAVGETATYRKLVGYVTGNADFGVGNTPRWSERPVTALLHMATWMEIQQAGGQVLQGDVVGTLIGVKPGLNDQVVWRGTVYRVESEFVPEAIVGASGYYGVLRRGDSKGA